MKQQVFAVFVSSLAFKLCIQSLIPLRPMPAHACRSAPPPARHYRRGRRARRVDRRRTRLPASPQSAPRARRPRRRHAPFGAGLPVAGRRRPHRRVQRPDV